ncbi:MAG: amidohydrolase [Flavobacteriales bacterium]|nr:amidohydrolase [Flavobacteriales bacterium]
MNLTVTIIQTALCWEDKAKNLAQFSEKIKAINSKTDIIVLPEMFSTGFSMNSEKLAEPMYGETVDWLKKQAKSKNAIIIASLIIEEDTKFFNRLIWMQPDGQHFHYDKRHLFTMAGEDQYFNAGENRLIVHYKGWRICPLICYDLRFPAWSRNISLAEPKNTHEFDCLIYIANWPTVRISHWNKLLEARAIENQCYVVGVNIIGKDGNEKEYSGNSAVIEPKGECISKTKPNEESVETLKLDLKELNDYRQKFPVIEDADDFHLDSYTLIANLKKDS